MSYTVAELQQMVVDAAARYGIDSGIALAQINQESGFRTGVTSYAGAQGIAQFMPGTWAQYGSGSPFDPVAALDAWGRYMRHLLDKFGGNYSLALAGYNAGEGNVTKYGGVPPFAQTQNYVASILRAAGNYAGSSLSPSSAPDSGSGASSNLVLIVVAILALGIVRNL